MAESTLSLTYPDLLQQVSQFLFGKWTTTDLTVAELAQCDAHIQSGYRRFLVPAPLPEDVQPRSSTGHVWSFLHPTATLPTVIDDVDYALPDDWGGLAGTVTVDSTSAVSPVVERGEGEIRGLWARGTVSGPPLKFAVRPLDPTGTDGQRFELILWPWPDAVYTMYLPYNVHPNKLTVAAPYPLGGMDHGETILECCLAVAERRSDDTIGIHQAAASEAMRASIARDRAVGVPNTLGYNGDASTDVGIPRAPYSTVNGAIPT